MRVCIAAIGSTGDVLPYLGLGQQLTAQGFEVTIATHKSFEPFVAGAGLGYAFVPMEPRDSVSDELGERLRHGVRSAAKAIEQLYAPWVWDIAQAVDAACAGTDHLLLSAMAWTGVHSADGRGVPSWGLHLQPLEPTGAFAPAAMGARSFGPAVNRALGRRVQALMVRPHMAVVNALRQRHGLPAVSARDHLRMLRDRRWPVLHGFSPSVVPRPADWRPGLDVVGYWWPPAPSDWTPDPDLVDFLGCGPAPIYVGFGSTLPAPAAELQAMLRRISRALRIRMVVHSGWLDLRVDDDTIHTVGHVPHSWLLPRVRAAVHHCGAGTSAATLRAGIPSVPVPTTLDQPFWADRLRRLGVATEPIHSARLTEARLTAEVREAIENPLLSRRAAEARERLVRDNGAVAVADALSRRGR
ncbi:glycosyltransferase family 1 protein [Dactylosporangium aurantiacum]|uniref:Glycosyltransferase family 1 protein n=1 Tax=Dactylosporangium aurantiacum TaxID=35754 RepID=A0A9Q9IR41_9ACTN|nr:glycosyltransferase [Dactylosporangium aurantiacum]MDG6106201.1 glycosyltransferase [Dactylosporangium aurantiacum]UWZ58297.1 glycosyltransferase family 1 protein [Dactylosporangium aurantiacum]